MRSGVAESGGTLGGSAAVCGRYLLYPSEWSADAGARTTGGGTRPSALSDGSYRPCAAGPGPQPATVSSSRKILFSTSNFWRLSASAYSGFFTRLPGPFITIWIFSLGMWCFSRTKEAS